MGLFESYDTYDRIMLLGDGNHVTQRRKRQAVRWIGNRANKVSLGSDTVTDFYMAMFFAQYDEKKLIVDLKSCLYFIQFTNVWGLLCTKQLVLYAIFSK